MDGKIILKWALKKKDGIMWTVIMWFKIGKSDRFVECGNEYSDTSANE